MNGKMAEKLAELREAREAREAREVVLTKISTSPTNKIQIENERLYSALTTELDRLDYLSDCGYAFQFSGWKTQIAWSDSDMPWKNIKHASLLIVIENLKNIQDPSDDIDTEDQEYQGIISEAIDKGVGCELIPKYLWDGR